MDDNIRLKFNSVRRNATNSNVSHAEFVFRSYRQSFSMASTQVLVRHMFCPLSVSIVGQRWCKVDCLSGRENVGVTWMMCFNGCTEASYQCDKI